MIKNYFSLVKFSHTVFALPFAFIGFCLAIYQEHYSFEWMLLLKVVLCMIFARTAAMAFNRYADRKIDSLNERTKSREIPAGIISERSALFLVVLSSTLFITTAFTINPLCFYLSPIVLLILLGYSFTKRFTFLCHLILGLALAIAPLGAYLAVTGKFDLLPALFSFSVLCWVSGFDIIYALQDEEFDRRHLLFSIPAKVGKEKAIVISKSLHIFSALFLLSAGWLGDLGILYWTGCLLFALLLIYQHSLVKPDDLSRINLAFFTTNGVASVIFSVFVIADLILN